MKLHVFKMKVKAFSNNWVQPRAAAKLAGSAVQWAIPSRPPQPPSLEGNFKLPEQLHCSLKHPGSGYRSKPRIHYHSRRSLSTHWMKLGNSTIIQQMWEEKWIVSWTYEHPWLKLTAALPIRNQDLIDEPLC